MPAFASTLSAVIILCKRFDRALDGAWRGRGSVRCSKHTHTAGYVWAMRMRLLLMGYGRHCSEVRPHMCADAGCSPGIAVSVAGAQLAGSPNAEGEALHRVCCEMWQRDGSSQPSASRCYTAVRVWRVGLPSPCVLLSPTTRVGLARQRQSTRRCPCGPLSTHPQHGARHFSRGVAASYGPRLSDCVVLPLWAVCNLT